MILQIEVLKNNPLSGYLVRAGDRKAFYGWLELMQALEVELLRAGKEPPTESSEIEPWGARRLSGGGNENILPDQG